MWGGVGGRWALTLYQRLTNGNHGLFTLQKKKEHIHTHCYHIQVANVMLCTFALNVGSSLKENQTLSQTGNSVLQAVWNFIPLYRLNSKLLTPCPMLYMYIKNSLCSCMYPYSQCIETSTPLPPPLPPALSHTLPNPQIQTFSSLSYSAHIPQVWCL